MCLLIVDVISSVSLCVRYCTVLSTFHQVNKEHTDRMLKYNVMKAESVTKFSSQIIFVKYVIFKCIVVWK
jgi:hypothetical protein